MQGFFLFGAGILVGTAIQTLVAQNPAGRPGVRLNHVGEQPADGKLRKATESWR